MQAALTDHLPGLDGALSPPLHNAGKLPLTGARDSQTYFGNACAKDGKQGGTLRVAAVSRSLNPRSQGTLHLTVQPDEAEGRRLSLLPPGERSAAQARTSAIPRTANRLASPSISLGTSSCGASPCSSSNCSNTPCSELVEASCMELSPAACRADAQEPLSRGSCTRPNPPAQRQPPPLPIHPGTSAAAAAPAGNAAGSQLVFEAQSLGPRVAAEWERQSCAGIPQQARPTELESYQQVLPAPLLALHSASATAMWRCMWLQGLQFHNAARSGQPIRAGSKWHFIPLDPNDALLSVLMFKTAVMPEHVIAGAARFQDILMGSQHLYTEAVATRVLSFGVWGVTAPDGSYRLLADGQQIAMPISFRCAPPHTVALYLACVWHEANRAEAAGHMSYSFSATGQRAVGDQCMLKYSPSELLEWVCLALGCEQAAHESVAALAHIAQFGAE
ncbi:hypothetical protein D9Q98_006365 [Chlorella vulgaris]|uniref:Uncharacterized protein n=1 Tax=Chlorella vulgaris TaxID=3077 RepID=A0A9D4TK86_CHLVU|nr:hypothetical protein D9Q98_006365 [Chlorella vulgaris]